MPVTKPTFTAKTIEHKVNQGKLIAVIERTYESHRPISEHEQIEMFNLAIIKYDVHHPDTENDHAFGRKPTEQSGTPSRLTEPPDDWWVRLAQVGTND